jgi:hypothetical protein
VYGLSVSEICGRLPLNLRDAFAQMNGAPRIGTSTEPRA